MLLAKSYMAGGNAAASRPILERDLETSPDDLFLNLSLGIVYGQLEQYEKAEACLRKVLAVRAKDPKAMSTLGSVYLSRKEYDRAERMFEDVLALDDVDIESRLVSLVNLGMIHYLVRKTPEQAIPYFKRALSVHPRSTDAHFYLAHIFSKKPETYADALQHGQDNRTHDARGAEPRALGDGREGRQLDAAAEGLEHLGLGGDGEVLLAAVALGEDPANPLCHHRDVVGGEELAVFLAHRGQVVGDSRRGLDRISAGT